jgi:hypothetical protein
MARFDIGDVVARDDDVGIRTGSEPYAELRIMDLSRAGPLRALAAGRRAARHDQQHVGQRPPLRRGTPTTYKPDQGQASLVRSD